MAKEEDEDGLPPIGDGTADFLDETKKGKPRSFLLINKGSKVRYLLVKKKRTKKSDITDAKKLGYKGEVSIGVITGKGLELVFNLAISDGYDAAPVKDKLLKDFIEEHTGIKCKPTFAIVATPPDIPDDDEEVTANADNTGSIPPPPPPPPPASPPPSPNPPQTAPVTQSTTADQPAATSGNAASNLQTDDDALRAKLQAALDKLVPQLKQAVSDHPQRKTELLTPVAAVKKHLQDGQLDAARQGLLDVGKLLKSILAGENSASANSDNSADIDKSANEYQTKLAELQPKYDRALKESLGDPNKYRALMAYITEQGEAGVYGKAIIAIDRLTTAIDQAISSGSKETDVIPENVVATRKKFLLSSWQAALEKMYADVEKLAEPIASLVPDEDPDELVTGITDELEKLTDGINDAIFLTQSASSQNAKPFDAALAAIRSFRSSLDSHPLIAVLERSQSALKTSVNVKQNLLGTLQELESNLTN